MTILKTNPDPKLNIWTTALDTLDSFGDSVSVKSFESACRAVGIHCDLGGIYFQFERNAIAIVERGKLIKVSPLGKKVLVAIRQEGKWVVDCRGIGENRQVLVDASGNLYWQAYEVHPQFKNALDSMLPNMVSSLVASFNYEHCSGAEYKISLY